MECEKKFDGIFYSVAGVEIPAPGEKPTFVEKLAKLEKQAACLLFRLGGISSC